MQKSLTRTVFSLLSLLFVYVSPGCSAERNESASPMPTEDALHVATPEDAMTPEIYPEDAAPGSAGAEAPSEVGADSIPEAAAAPESAVAEAVPFPPDTADRSAAPGSSQTASNPKTVVIRQPDLGGSPKGYSVERVFFATNRSQAADAKPASDPDTWFGASSGELVYGSCEISMPYRRQPGTLPEPSIMRFEFRQDPSRHVVLMQLELLPDGEFWKQLNSEVSQSPEKQLLMFVHGYSASFRDAARRTAQLAFDMNYKGPSMFFSWPAGSSSEGLSRWNYLTDLRRADESKEDLVSILESVAAKSGARRIHLVAHSMGNHLLTESLKVMADRNMAIREGGSMFDSVAMAAPDLNASEFVGRTANRIRRFARNFTVYASMNDKALMFSREVNGWDPLGLIGPVTARVKDLPAFQLVDASAVSAGWFSSGHVYYGDMPEVIADLRCVFSGMPTERRGLLPGPSAFRLVRHSR